MSYDSITRVFHFFLTCWPFLAGSQLWVVRGNHKPHLQLSFDRSPSNTPEECRAGPASLSFLSCASRSVRRGEVEGRDGPGAHQQRCCPFKRQAWAHAHAQSGRCAHMRSGAADVYGGRGRGGAAGPRTGEGRPRSSRSRPREPDLAGRPSPEVEPPPPPPSARLVAGGGVSPWTPPSSLSPLLSPGPERLDPPPGGVPLGFGVLLSCLRLPPDFPGRLSPPSPSPLTGDSPQPPPGVSPSSPSPTSVPQPSPLRLPLPVPGLPPPASLPSTFQPTQAFILQDRVSFPCCAPLGGCPGCALWFAL